MNFEHPSNPEEVSSAEASAENPELSPELSQEVQKFEDSVEEISAKVDNADLEQASEEDLENLSDKTRFVLSALLMALGAGAMIAGDIIPYGHDQPLTEQITKALALGGGVFGMISGGRFFGNALGKLERTYGTVREAFLKKHPEENFENNK